MERDAHFPPSPRRRFALSAGGVWELFLVLSGAAAVLTFDDNGTVTARTELWFGGEVQGVELPPGVWHSLVSLAPDTVLFEVKPGPYRPTGENDFAAWAPPEGATASAAFVEWMARAAVGERPPAMA